jgi:predicted DNA-binding ArsR family transcriptional regulator
VKFLSERMIKFNLVLFLFIVCFTSQAQITRADYYNTIDNKVYSFSKQKPNAPFDTIVHFVNSGFVSQEDKARAYYAWTALNIAYDVEHMNEINLIQIFNINTITSSNQKTADVLRNKKAVCEGYANVMTDLCRASNIPCFTVCGYTKNPEGEIPEILHAWNVLRLDSAWHMLDVTWSSGYVDPLNHFVKRFSNEYFLPRPKVFIKDHFPLDPMWQLLKNPFTKQDFERDSLNFSKAPSFNFPDSIRQYRAYTEKEQKRIDFQHYYRADPSNKNHARNLDVANNNMLADYLNTATVYHSDFIEQATKKLSQKPTLTECKKARANLDSAKVYYNKAQLVLNTTKAYTPEYTGVFSNMQASIEDNNKNIAQNTEYLNKLQAYLKKKK